MLISAAEIETEVLDADLCIVGGGAAGIAMAREFIGTSTRVLLLEAGPLHFSARDQARYEGEVSGVRYIPLETSRLRYFGGTTGHWAGQSVPLDPLDLRERPWVPNSGWPIEYGDLSRYLARAAGICQVVLPPVDPWQARDPIPPFPVGMGPFEPAVLRFPESPPRFGDLYRRDIAEADSVTCLLEATVLDLAANEARTHVNEVQIAGPEGRRLRARARTFVLAMGGIENSRHLLLNPVGDERATANVGRYFMEHPQLNIAEAVLPDPSRAVYLADGDRRDEDEPARLHFRLPEVPQREFEILNHSVSLLPVVEGGPQGSGFIARVWRRLGEYAEAMFGAELPTDFEVNIRLEQAPIADSRVRLGEATDEFGRRVPDLRLEFSELEERTVERVGTELARALGVAELGRLRFDMDEIRERWDRRLRFQFHHCGGTRMHDDPAQGVVDANCRVHGVDNLYVAGSSVFTTSGHANPTMNLVALALRLVDYLKDQGTA